MLCRIYNKKGSLEKNYSAAHQKVEEVEFTEMEDTKPEIAKMPPMQQPPFAANEHFYMDTSDSMPKLHTSDSSSSGEHVVSSDITCDKEVQSEPKWNPLANSNGLDFNFNYVDSNGFSDDPFGLQAQYQMDQLYSMQDMFTFPQMPF